MEMTNDELIEFKKYLDGIAPHFCAAKWVQVTLHLNIGQNHSCHHPKTHPIPKECVDNPYLLHNTPYKKQMWKDIMDKKIIPECEYCNLMEENSKMFSDRILKSKENWAGVDRINEILNDPLRDRMPSYVEVNFSNVCNCQCSYCSPWISSLWQQDTESNGAYPTSNLFGSLDKNRHQVEGNNIYKEAFWKWWPELVKNLSHFRITGGEPLLNKDTFKVIDYILENPSPNLALSFNTNFCVSEKIIDKFIKKMELLIQNKCVKHLQIFSSCEAHGKAAEYSRFGLDYKFWWKCVDKLLTVPKIKFTIMSTFNIFSITTFKYFLADVYERKRKYADRIILDTPFLRKPSFLCAYILTPDFIDYVEKAITFMYEHRESPEWKPLDRKGFLNYEIEKVKRIYYIMQTMTNDKKQDYTLKRADFYRFINEWDKRKNINFLKTFPEMEKFYNICKVEDK